MTFLLSSAAMLVSLLYVIGYATSSDPICVGIWEGWIWIQTRSPDDGFRSGLGWQISRMKEPGRFRWWLEYGSDVLPGYHGTLEQFTWLHLPLWIPILLSFSLTVFLSWHDRLTPPGHCQQCNYSLTGNTSGVCPECGTAILSSGIDAPDLGERRGQKEN